MTLRHDDRRSTSVLPRGLLALMDVDEAGVSPLGIHCERPMTVLFSDIRNFTTMSESMSPAECFDFINAHLGVMEPCITRHGGLVDKYVGDAIMAIFPDDADAAVCAGLEMLEALRGSNAARVAHGEPPLEVGVGLNTGLVALGTVGGPTRRQTTVIGDAVNLSSRLETATKTYGTPLIIGERTLYNLSDPSRFATRFLDRIRVKGKRHPESLYEVFDGDPPVQRAAKLRTRREFEEALAFYHLHEAARAVPLLERCIAAVPGDVPAAIYLQRCHEFLATGRHEGTGELEGRLEWSDALSLGVGPIDAQHQELLARINHLGDEVRGCDAGGRNDVLRFVAEYALAHFAFEEDLMRQTDYPFRAQHEHEHRVFVRYFGELQREIADGTHDPLYLVFRVQIFLVDWFVNHTSRTDRHLAKHLQGLGSERAPSTLL